MKTPRAKRLLLLAATLAASTAAHAATYTTNGASTDFEANTWGGPLVQNMTAADTMNIRSGRTITLDNATASYTGGTLAIGNIPAFNNGTVGTLNVVAGNLTYTTAVLGSVADQGGVINLYGNSRFQLTTGVLSLGNSSNATGTLNINDTAAFKTGGPVNIGNNTSASSGAINLNGGTLEIAGITAIGNNADGRITLNTGAIIANTTDTRVGVNANSSGRLLITGGTYYANNTYIGYGGAAASTASGQLTLNNTGTLRANILSIGNNATGNASIDTGATLVLTSELRLGQSSQGNGTLAMTGGTVTGVTNLLVGGLGAGNAIITGGTLTAAKIFVGGSAAASSGTLAIGPAADITASNFEMRNNGQLRFLIGSAAAFNTLDITGAAAPTLGSGTITADLSDFRGTLAGTTPVTLLTLNTAATPVGVSNITLLDPAQATYTDGLFNYTYDGTLSWSPDLKNLILTITTTAMPIPEPATTALLLALSALLLLKLRPRRQT